HHPSSTQFPYTTLFRSIFPGILPIQSVSQTRRIATLCGAKIPPAMLASLEKLGDNDEATMQFGIDYATRQCAELLRGGAPGLHIDRKSTRLNSSHQIIS